MSSALETTCRCGHVWSPDLWLDPGNVRCPECGAWNQVGETHPLFGSAGAIKARMEAMLPEDVRGGELVEGLLGDAAVEIAKVYLPDGAPEVVQSYDDFVQRFGRRRWVAARVPGGFRSRWRVQWVRLVWLTARHAPGMLRAGFEAAAEEFQQQERQRVCPHPAEYRGGVRGALCDLCGARVR